MITDQAQGSPRVVLWGEAAEVHAWLCFMELLCFDMYPMSATGCMLLCKCVCVCEGKNTHTSHRSHHAALWLVCLEKGWCVLLKPSPGLDNWVSVEQKWPLVEEMENTNLLMTPRRLWLLMLSRIPLVPMLSRIPLVWNRKYLFGLMGGRTGLLHQTQALTILGELSL